MEEQPMEEQLTSICNVKVAHIRPKYANLKEWMEDPENIYVGRAGVVFIDGKRYPSKPSKWCNPFKIGKDGDREQVIEKYKKYISEQLIENPELLDELKNLRGKQLGCWCVSSTEYYPTNCYECHGQVLVNMIHEL